MAITLPGYVKAAVLWGLPTKLEIRQQGTGSFVVVGAFDGFDLSVDPLSKPGDPAGTSVVHALRYSVTFNMLQTAKTTQVATMMAGTAGTGLFETDAELKITFASGTVITLGAVTACPLRLVASYSSGTGDGAAIMKVSGTNIEPITSFGGKLA